MHKLSFALALVVAVCLAAAAAAAADPGPIQVSGQSATTSQQAGAASSASQTNPTNTNISIRVLSPGNDGNVTQTNSAASSASAGNTAGTTQASNQGAAGAAIQTAQQTAATDQLAAALSAAKQDNPTNTNVPIRVLSPGDGGTVDQTNSADSRADAGNAATTGQSANQTASTAPCTCGGTGGIQNADQSASTGQQAGAASAAIQDHPTNTAVAIRVLSPGNNGDVSQTNSAASSASAGNKAATTQGSTQSQSGGCGCTSAPTGSIWGASPDAAPASTDGSLGTGSVGQQNSDASSASAGNGASTNQNTSQGNGSAGIQTGDQSAATEQHAGAISIAKQIHPSNTADPVRVLSPGNDGNVSQTNDVASSARSGNDASTKQDTKQSQDGSCGCGGTAIQIAGQKASTAQAALAASAAEQFGASNDASPVRVKSPGDGGSVKQANTVASSANAGNAAWTNQTGNQTAGAGKCGCGGAPIQVLGQKATTEQGSVALSKAVQVFGERKSPCGCGGEASGNVASPVRVKSPGNDGSVDQQNTVGSTANTGNKSSTTQGGSQSAAGGGLAIQVIGQYADTGQLAAAASLAAQAGASNEASPVRVKSPGDGGSVSQANDVGSSANAGNDSYTTQGVRQTVGRTPCGCGPLPIQVVGQKADTGQLAKALSAALQLWPSNDSSPVRVKSTGGDGWAAQENASGSRGDAGNRATTGGEAMQSS